jgi:hypothetical protein
MNSVTVTDEIQKWLENFTENTVTHNFFGGRERIA